MNFYVYYIDNAARRGGTSLRWSKEFASAAEARRWAKEKVDAGKATLACVFEFEGPGKPGTLRRQEVYPASAQKMIGHYLTMAQHASAGQPPDH